MAEAKYGNLTFREAVEFFRNKTLVPAERWSDIWRTQHNSAFMSAGAMQADLLADLHKAVDHAIAGGGTLERFRKEFDQIVERHGWGYNGGRNWRTRVIYDTNLRQAYNAGREAQMADPALQKRRPYGLYRHRDSNYPRPEHLAWDGLVIPLDDPWWETHTPQNGWGCKCQKFMVGDRDLQRMGKTGPDRAPKIERREWVDKGTGQVHDVPVGIDPGFDYRPLANSIERQKQLIAAKAQALPQAIGQVLEQKIADIPPAPEFPGEADD